LITATFTLTLGFLALLALSGTFSGSETALFSLDRLERRRFEQSRSGPARLVTKMMARPERLLAGILFGNTLVNVAGSSVMLAISRRIEDYLFGRDPVTASVVLATGCVLVLGEIVPKGIAVHWPSRFAVALAPFLYPLLTIMTPVSRLLERVALLFLRSVGVREERSAGGLGWRELQLLFEDIQKGDEMSEDEGLMASNIFEFFETRAYEIMTPRVDVVAVSLDAPRDELKERVIDARHSRLPVFRESLDHVIGFLNTKEFLLDPEAPTEALLRPVHYVPERARLHRILADVQARRLSLVVVVNEYGGTAGIITQEDLVEEVVGEIFDEQERDHAPEVEKTGEDTWRVAGLLSLENLAETVGVDLPSTPAETVAGHVAHLLGRLPRTGDAAEDGVLRYEVLQVKRHRAQRVLATVLANEGGRNEPA
jgi:CBS domain containing-hemolysin-like protein